VTPVERVASRVLFWGGALSVTLMLVGLIGYGVRSGFHGESLNVDRVLENREHGRAADVFVSVRGIRRGLGHWPVDPVALSALGMVMLFATPVLAVGLAVPGFVRQGDLRYGGISAVIVGVLVLSFLLGAAG